MNPSRERTILRWIHVIFALPIVGYVYGPAAEVEQYAPVFRFVFLPVVIATGFWMWKGHAVRRMIKRD
ncbi:MAG: hypothetical protein K1X57_13840 [Gemmataceae bacterium]|nr:hypothetical protein [Gemmataceae bacterium]